MPYHLELGSDGHNFNGKAIVVNSQTGKHYSLEPIPIDKAKAQKRVLEMSEPEMSEHKSSMKPVEKSEMSDYMPKDRRKAIMEYKHSRKDPSPDRSKVVGPVDSMRARVLGMSLFPNIFNKKYIEEQGATN